MIKNVIVTALRNIRKHKVFSLFNIAGLAVALAVFLLAATYGAFSRSFDTFHRKAGRTFELVQVRRTGNAGHQNSAILPYLVPLEMKDRFPEIESVVRLYRSRVVMRAGDRKFNEWRVFFVDPEFLQVFDFDLVAGNPDTALSGVDSVVLTEDSAAKYFGKENPLGKTLTIEGGMDLRVAGVAKRMPLNTSLAFDFLLPLEAARTLYGLGDERLADCTNAFMILGRDADPNRLEAKLPGFIAGAYGSAPEAPERLFFLPLTDSRIKAEGLHLKSYLDSGTPYSVVFFFYLIGAAALLMASVNFMNLSTAYYSVRAKEVGLRKVVGATRADLVRQFLGESVLQALVALPLALLLHPPLQKAFVAYMGTAMDLALASHPSVLPVLVAVAAAVGLLSGSYPAFYLSSFRPVQVLKGRGPTRARRPVLRKALVVSQFAMSVMLIVFTAATKKQVDYLRALDFGFNWKDVLSVPVPENLQTDLGVIKESFLEDSRVAAVAGSHFRPINVPGVDLEVVPEEYGGRDKWAMKGFPVDFGFIEMLGIRVAEGRSFSRERADAASLVINETASRQLGWDDPLGKTLNFDGRTGTIIGVVADFIYNEIHFKQDPTLLYVAPGEYAYLLVKTAGGHPSDPALLTSLEERWNSLAPDLPFEPVSLSAVFDDHYTYVTQMSVTFGIVGGFAIVVASLGLLGLTSYAVGRKKKEIGIRKTLGATMGSVFKMLFSEFMRLIVVANLVALPLAYFLVQGFMRWAWNFRVGIGPGIFVLAAVLTLAASAASICAHTLKAARTDPVEALRYE